MIDLELILNIAIIALLIPTILYLVKLNKNLNILRNNQRSLTQLSKSLNEASIKAENAIPKLKSAATSAAEELMNITNAAKIAKKELEYSNGRAEFLAGKLEDTIYSTKYPTDNRERPQVSKKARVTDYSLLASTPKPKVEAIKEPEYEEDFREERSEAEAELLQALKSIK